MAARCKVFTRAKKKQALKLAQDQRLNEARDLLVQVCNRDKMDAGAWYDLGIIHGRLHEYSQAENCFRRVLEIVSNQVEAYTNLGASLEDQGKLDEALNAYLLAQKNEPASARIAGLIANIYQKTGNHLEGYKSIEHFLHTRQLHVELVLAYSYICRYHGNCTEALQLIHEVARSHSISPQERMLLHFRMGEMHEQNEEYEKAFDTYSKANQLKCARFDSKAHRKKIEQVISKYTCENIVCMPRSHNRSELPVFIVGMPRSGTSLLEQILAGHSSVYAGGEKADILEIVKSLSSEYSNGLPYLGDIDLLMDDNVNIVADRYIEALSRDAKGATRVTDKMPLNCLFLGLIARLFPSAKVIHCTRSPLDTCISCYFLDFKDNHEHSYDLSDLGNFYKEYRLLMDHWKSVLDLDILDVRYENLVDNTENISREIVEFLGLEWEEQCLRFYELNRQVKTASYDQVRKPIYRQSMNRWKYYEPFIEPLISSLHSE